LQYQIGTGNWLLECIKGSKKMVFGRKISLSVIGLIIFGSSFSFAATKTSLRKGEMSKDEASASSVFLSQLLSSVEKANLDFEVSGSYDPDNGMIADFLKGTSMVKFNSDWIVPPQTNNSESGEGSSEVSRIMPTLTIDAKDATAAVSMDRSVGVTSMSLNFYKGYDQKTKKWIPRPLTLSVSNELNKVFLQIRFNWFHVQINESLDPNKPATVKGTCDSVKVSNDMRNELNEAQVIPVKCEFSGTYGKDGPKIKFKFVNEQPMVNSGMP
jgi:hypothetical protein